MYYFLNLYLVIFLLSFFQIYSSSTSNVSDYDTEKTKTKQKSHTIASSNILGNVFGNKRRKAGKTNYEYYFIYLLGSSKTLCSTY